MRNDRIATTVASTVAGISAPTTKMPDRLCENK